MTARKDHTNRSPYHPDVVLFLILIPFISAFNYYLTYTNIRLNWFLVLTFSIDTLQGYAAWWAVRKLIFLFDQKMPFEEQPIRRIVVQVLSTTLVGLFIITTSTEAVSWIAKGKPAHQSFYALDLFIISIWFFVINGIYVGLYYYNLWKRAEEKFLTNSRIKLEGLMVRSGKQELKLNFDSIFGFYVDGEYVVACDLSGKKYYLDQSLDKLEDELPTDLFFRLNRQFILHRQQLTGFKRADYGKLIVMLKSNELFPSEITVSRIKAAAFKGWFRP